MPLQLFKAEKNMLAADNKNSFGLDSLFAISWDLHWGSFFIDIEAFKVF